MRKQTSGMSILIRTRPRYYTRTMSDPKVLILVDGELTYDFTGLDFFDKGLDAVIYNVDASKNVQMFIDDVEYDLPPSDCTNLKPMGEFIISFLSWQQRTLRKHIKYCLDIHRSFYP